jgi:hypothetical protein
MTLKQTLLAMTLVFAACGRADDGSAVKTAPEAPAPSERVAFVMQAELGAVRATTAPVGASGVWSAIDVTYAVDCAETVETFSYALRPGSDGRLQVLVSAIGSRPVNLADSPCLGVSRETRTITAAGFLTADSVELVNLRGVDVAIPPATAALTASPRLEVVSTRRLCPEGMVCVTDGTIVRLMTTLDGCLDQLGPVSHAAVSTRDQSGLDRLELAVSGVQLANKGSRHVRCFAPNVQFTEIAFPGSFVTAKTIDLSVLR